MCKTIVSTDAIWCNSAVYCSSDCQIQHTVVQRTTACSPTKNVGWGPDSVTIRSQLPGGPPEVKHGFKNVLPNSIGGISQDWTIDLPRNATLYERTFERLIDSYRLRVEDVKVHGKEKGVDELKDFSNYFKMAKKHKVLPTWWNGQCDQQLLLAAKNRVNVPASQTQLLKAHGAFEPMILRMMAGKIHGSPLVPSLI